MLTQIHAESSGPLLGSNQPFCAHFTVKNCLHPLRRIGSGLIQETLIGLHVIADNLIRLGNLPEPAMAAARPSRGACPEV
jgi:hypothetical protein